MRSNVHSNPAGAVFVATDFGRLADAAIVAAAEERGAGLIVVGSKGKTGWRRVLLGSVAESVVQRARCSVLVVRLDPAAGSARIRRPGGVSFGS